MLQDDTRSPQCQAEMDFCDDLSTETLLHNLMYFMLPESVCISIKINFHSFCAFYDTLKS